MSPNTALPREGFMLSSTVHSPNRSLSMRAKGAASTGRAATSATMNLPPISRTATRRISPLKVFSSYPLSPLAAIYALTSAMTSAHHGACMGQSSAGTMRWLRGA